MNNKPYISINENTLNQSRFIQQYSANWKAFESFVDGEIKLSPDDVAHAYIQLLDDLSYAQTAYPGSKLVYYLNDLAVKAHQRIYKSKKQDRSALKTFFSTDIPLAIYHSRKALKISLLVFVISIAIGMISCLIDNDFPRLILGDHYVNITLQNIEDGDPMAIYKKADQDHMLFAIGSNNIMVSLFAYLLGLIGAIFSGFFLVVNGVMVGAFQYFFIAKGLGWISFSTIFIHGALELSAIVIVCGAGIVLGNSWWYPGTFSRKTALIRGGQQSIKIIVAIIPVLIFAAILESFVTRYYLEMPDILRFLIIALSFGYIYWYFVYLPKKVFERSQAHLGPNHTNEQLNVE